MVKNCSVCKKRSVVEKDGMGFVLRSKQYLEDEVISCRRWGLFFFVLSLLPFVLLFLITALSGGYNFVFSVMVLFVVAVLDVCGVFFLLLSRVYRNERIMLYGVD